VNVYEGLVANDRHVELVDAENLTNPRLRSLNRITQVLQTDVATSAKLQNWNLAPFAYGNPDGTTFFGEDRPCLELALDRQTALAVSVAKRQAFLEATQEPPMGLDMRMLRTPVSGFFWDLRNIADRPAALSQADRLNVGKKMPINAHGILYQPVERPSSTCIAIVVGDVLERSVQTVHFRYVWDGSRITQLYTFDNQGTLIDAASLASEIDILAA